jgi:hypothetical protein
LVCLSSALLQICRFSALDITERGLCGIYLGLHGNTASTAFIMAVECENLVKVYSLMASNLGGGDRLAVHKNICGKP